MTLKWYNSIMVNFNGKTVKNRGTHIGHCCLKHGCKYGDDYTSEYYCPVTAGEDDQEYPCEYCPDNEEQILDQIKDLEQELEFARKLKALRYVRKQRAKNG